MPPEARARQKIDELLTAAGWTVQDRDQINLGGSLGVAVREFSVTTGATDYLLYADRKACGVLEARPEGVTLIGFEEQSGKYLGALKPGIPSWGTSLIFAYESTGSETRFTDHRDSEPRSRRLFAFHRPEFLLDTLKQGSSLRRRLQLLPAVDPAGLRDCQTEAMTSLDASFKRGDPILFMVPSGRMYVTHREPMWPQSAVAGWTACQTVSVRREGLIRREIGTCIPPIAHVGRKISVPSNPRNSPSQ